MKKYLKTMTATTLAIIFPITAASAEVEDEINFSNESYKKLNVSFGMSDVVNGSALPNNKTNTLMLEYLNCKKDGYDTEDCGGVETRIQGASGTVESLGSADFKAVDVSLVYVSKLPLYKNFNSYVKSGLGGEIRSIVAHDGGKSSVCHGGKTFIELGVTTDISKSFFMSLSHRWSETFMTKCSGIQLDDKEKGREISLQLGLKF